MMGIKFPCVVMMACLLWGKTGYAQESPTCEANSDVPVTVTPVFDEARYDYSVDINSIRGLLGDTPHSIQENHDSLPLGVTHYEPTLEFRLPTKTVTWSNGMSCTQVESANVTIGYRNVTVYIAREVPNGSCGFAEIMAHEQKHIAVNRDVLWEYAGRIEMEMKSYLSVDNTFYEENPTYAVETLNRRLNEMLHRFGQQMIDDNSARQAQVDTLQEYQRLSETCNGQLAQIATQHGRHP
jgi:hypothetical protein